MQRHRQMLIRRRGGARMPRLIEAERDMMRRAGRFNAQLMDMLREHVAPGVATGKLDRLAYDFIKDHGHLPACLGYKGYPKTICTSINDVVCHGIPDDREELREGDLVNIDVTTIVDGWHGDSSETFLLGEVSDDARRVTQAAFDSLYIGIDALSPGCRVSDLAEAITLEAHRREMSVVRDYVGHGIGTKFHQDPSIVHYPTPESKRRMLPPGVCFTVEPMINLGIYGTDLDSVDGWTVRTKDGQLSAQFEHTILMTEEGPEVLTFTENGPRRGHKF